MYRLSDDALLVSTVAIGMMVGLVIVMYHAVLDVFDGAFHALSPSAWRSAETSTVGLIALVIPLCTMAGGLAIGLLKRYAFRGIDHQGMHSVAMSLRQTTEPMTWRHALHAILLSSISIASGGGAGREAPTVILGASVATWIGRLGRMDRAHIRILGAAGAAAAISGIFNAPLGGILFAIEAITGEFRSRTFIPVVIASVMSTTVVRTILGSSSLLVAPTLTPVALTDYPLLALAGVLSAFVAAGYLNVYRSVHRSVRSTTANLPMLLRPAVGGLAAGLPLMVLPWLLETSYRPVNMAISGSMHDVWWVGVLLAVATIILKPVTNAITLASGGEGGTFAPILKVGALFGFCLGALLEQMMPTSLGLYAIVCSAAVIAGAFRAPLTGAILLFEISGNYGLLLPLLFASVVSVYIVRRLTTATFNPLDDEPEPSPPINVNHP